MFMRFLVVALGVVCLMGADWRQFRGNENRGVSQNAPPVEFDGKIAWRVDTPGRSASSPIVVGNKVIVTAASGAKQDRLHVLALDLESGKQLWHRQFWATGRTLCHPFSSIAANTPASDGKRIFAFFSCNDLICLDLDGNLQWLRGITYDFPTAANDVGMCASPCVVGDTVVLQVETEGASFMTGLDTATGKERWKTDRPHAMNWTSPAVAPGQGVAVVSSTTMSVVEPRTGKELWKYDANFGNVVSPVVANGITYLATQDGVTAVQQVGSTQEASVRWSQNKLKPASASPVVYQNHIYTLARSGVLTCANIDDGKVEWQHRLKGPFWATPVAADGHLWCFNLDGLCQVVKLGDEPETVATNELPGKVFGSPAAINGSLVVRGEKQVWRIK